MHQDLNVKLSLCMIVKDEASMLPEFLERVRGLWDELVVVDTGSKDQTVAILEAEGAKILHHPWQNDFALARNQSLEAARGEWIVFLDPDEYASEQFVAQARALISDPTVGAATVNMQNLREDGHVQEEHIVRMFRRHRDVRFRHAIHEDLADTLLPRLRQSGRVLVHLDGPIEHHGYERAHAQARGKKQRDTSIINDTLTRNPGDLYLHFKLLEQARFWGDQELAQRAAPEALVAWNQTPAGEMGHWAGELAVMLVDGMTTGRPDEALRQLQVFSKKISNSPAIAYRLGELFETLDRLDEAREVFEAALKADGPVINKQLGTIRPQMGLVRLSIANNDIAAAIAHLKTAQKLAPKDPEVQFTASVLLY
jgi:tetratricopeptide (TPR) repeat protein